MARYIIIGGGLAGCECALTLARFGIPSIIYEQKPIYYSGAHVSAGLAELVCSNSLRSDDRLSGVGLLKAEMRQLGSSVLAAAAQCQVAAGKALAVDRHRFSEILTHAVMRNPAIEVVRERIDDLDDARLTGGDALIILAAGPLAGGEIAQSLLKISGQANCYFYDAIAPIIWTDSVNEKKAFRASRYDASGADYLNCPMNRDEYMRFYTELVSGKTYCGHLDESEKHFEGCMPIEAMAAGGPQTLTFGPMKPVGLIDPVTGERPWAVLQLRAETANMETCNLVGCQTKLLHAEQERIFRLVPGLENAQFARHGSMHRNTYVNAPAVLGADLSLLARPNIYVAGQLSGVEGYVESAATGLWLGHYLAARAGGRKLQTPPEESAIGALLAHLRRPARNFQPSNINFGLMPELKQKTRRAQRKEKYAQRAEKAFLEWLAASGY